MSVAFVDLPNVKLWITDTGSTGDPVILLHANTGTAESWQKQMPVLAQAGYRAIAFELPGKGKRGVERADDRRVISGIVHVLKSGCR